MSENTTAPFVKVTRTINRPIEDVFDYTMGVDLTRIFPETQSTTVPTGWGTAGQERVNTSKDGSSRREQLTAVERPTGFSYRVWDFTTPNLKENLDHIEGSWTYTDNGNATTSIDWIYNLIPREPNLRDKVQADLIPNYQTRLEKALSIIKDDLEK